MTNSLSEKHVDAVIVGAGMSGLYMLHRLRQSGFNTIVLEKADDVGGTWYWNRYPGARCDIQSLDYQFSFDPELEKDWQWTEKYATQPEILRYLEHVADRYDLRKDIQFNTEVKSAQWDEAKNQWRLTTSDGSSVTAQFYIMATGCLSVPKQPDIPGVSNFKGDTYITGLWPHDQINFEGKRVAVIGTGSSGIQSIPLIADQADEVFVFQRTPNFSMPAGNGPIPQAKRDAIAADPVAYRMEARLSSGGVPYTMPTESALAVSEEERHKRYEIVWQKGELFAASESFNDLMLNPAANETFAEFIRGKIRETVVNPETAELLCPKTYPVGSKRPCLDTKYYQTFNLPHVHLMDLHTNPITSITSSGIQLNNESIEVDAIVFATGFDAMTGALTSVDIHGKNNQTLKQKWSSGPKTYLGLMSVDFPNLFTITGPGSPSVLSNMVVSIEQHVDWITDCLTAMRDKGDHVIEPTSTAEDGWVTHVNDCADISLFPQANSWYVGANVPGKPRVFLPYLGGVGGYRETCDRVVAADYLGFRFSGNNGEHCNDGIINQLQPDVAQFLQMAAEANLPALESLPVESARELSIALGKNNPPGPNVGEVIDGKYPGADGELDFRFYRPASPGPHPLVCYFHGGGFVLGSQISDDAFCRDLCHRSDMAIISLNYRHAPEAVFPAAHEDAYTAVQWVFNNAKDFECDPQQLMIAGWSAGGNLAAATCQRIRDEGGPNILGQLLVTPAVDCDFSRQSYQENGDGFVLTYSMMQWFWDNYCEPGKRTDPVAVPLRANRLSDLPPAAIFTCQFDPLRNEGQAYSLALQKAGVKSEHYFCRGHIHTSLHAVDLLPSSAKHREEMANALKGFIR